jgi:hypothetical protein
MDSVRKWRRRRRRALPIAAAAALAGLAAFPGSAGAAITGGGGGTCTGATGSLTLTPTTVFLGQPVSASWSATLPQGCNTADTELTGPGVSILGGVGGVGGVATLTPALGVSTYTEIVGYQTGTVTVATASVRVEAVPHVPTVAWTTSGGTVDEIGPQGGSGQMASGLAAAAGSSPATTWDLVGGGRAGAVNAADTHTLKYLPAGSNSPVDTGIGMAAGASPAIAGLTSGAEVVAVGSDNYVREANTATGALAFPGGSPVGVAVGTDPAVAADAFGGFAVAVHSFGDSDHLWWVDRSNTTNNTGIAMAPGTSPSIAEQPGTGSYWIAYVRAGDNHLAVFNTADSTVTAYGTEPAAAGTSPVIRDYNSGPGYTIAFVGADDHALWWQTSSSPAADSHIPVAPGTRPAAAYLTGTSLQLLVNNAATHTIWQFTSDPGSTGVDTGFPIAANTNPAEGNVFDYPGATMPAMTGAAPPPAVPGAAPVLSPITVNGSTATLSFTDPGSTDLYFQILRRNAAGGPQQGVGTVPDNPGTTGGTFTFTDTVPAGTTACYTVRAAYGTSTADSNEECTAPPPAVMPPADLAFGMDTNLATQGMRSSIAVGTDGLGLIAFEDVINNRLDVGHCADADCSAITTTVLDSAGDVGAFMSLKIGTDGLGVIAYLDFTNEDLKVAHCSNIACTAATITSLDQPSNVEPAISETIGGDGNPLIAYTTVTGKPDDPTTIKVAHCLNAACTSANLAVIGSTGLNQITNGPVVTTGPDGNGIITYATDTSSHAATVACGNPDCTDLNADTAVSGIGLEPAMAIGRDGLGLAAGNSGNSVIVSHCLNVTCTATSTPVTAGVGSIEAPSVAIGGDGLGVVAYYDSTNQDLDVAHCADPACSTVTNTAVDQFGNEGEHPSITIGSDGLPLISYSGDQGLKVVHCADPACQQLIGTVF